MFVRARNSRFSAKELWALLRALWMPVAGAVLLGVALPIIAGRFDPLGLSAQLDSLLDADQLLRFRRVWWIHTGLYAGLAIGLAALLNRQKSDQRLI